MLEQIFDLLAFFQGCFLLLTMFLTQDKLVVETLSKKILNTIQLVLGTLLICTVLAKKFNIFATSAQVHIGIIVSAITCSTIIVIYYFVAKYAQSYMLIEALLTQFILSLCAFFMNRLTKIMPAQVGEDNL